MELYRGITNDDIRNLRAELMDALDELADLEHRFQKAENVVRKAGKVAETIRSWSDDKPKQSPKKPDASEGLKFLSVAEVAKRWGCSSVTVNRMVRKDILPKTYLGARIIRISLEDIEKYEADCRG